jgi:hypothetical protein
MTVPAAPHTSTTPGPYAELLRITQDTRRMVQDWLTKMAKLDASTSTTVATPAPAITENRG